MIRKSITALLALGFSSTLFASTIPEDCHSCEIDLPYTLKIISSGEAHPRSGNDSTEGRQDNRRVDVTIAQEVAPDTISDRRVELEQGGIIWLTRDPSSLHRDLRVEGPSAVTISGGKLTGPMSFNLRSNYTAFIEHWEFLIFESGIKVYDNPLAVISGKELSGNQQIFWNAEQLRERELEHGKHLDYVLRVYDKTGAFDQTQHYTMRLIDKEIGDKDFDINRQTVDRMVQPNNGYVEPFLQGIQINGAKVRIRGLEINERNSLSINGKGIKVSKDGKFNFEYILPRGLHEFTIVENVRGEEILRENLKVDLSSDYFFMVGLADLTLGKNAVKGSIEPLSVDEHHYGGDIFVDGRLAFYLKGKIKGKYLITAQMDTGTENVSKLFDNFHRKDPESVFRRIDPDQYYPIYGDDSLLYDDTDSQGKFYIRLEWDKSRVIWGNYNTSFSGTELAQFNRSLYGAKIAHRDNSNTSLGDSKTEFAAFASQAQTAFRHNEFLATGGSLYYLKDRDIVRGSEKVSVEIRQNGSERVVEKIHLVAGRDYEIDGFQGRLILTRPLISVSQQVGPSIIRNEPLDGGNTWLIVDYEYAADLFSVGEETVGTRAKTWLTDHIAVGGTWAHENRNVDAYDIKGADVTVKISDETYMRAEIAQSESNQTSGSFISSDGGLTFDINNDTVVAGGQAMSFDARVSANDFNTTNMDISVGAWVKQIDAGFSVANVNTGNDTRHAGIEVIADVSKNLQASARSTLLEKKSLSSDSVLAAQLDYAATERLDASAEFRHVKAEDYATDSRTRATLAAGKIAYDLTENLNVFGIAQGTISHNQTYERNNLLTLGSVVEFEKKLRLNAELSQGDRGAGALLGAEWLATQDYNLYSNIKTQFKGGINDSQAITVGQRKKISQNLRIYSEHQLIHSDSREGISHTIGLNHAVSRFTTVRLSLQSGRFDDQNGDTTDRDSLSLGLDFQHDKTNFSSRLEYRRDVGSTTNVDQWVMTNRLEHQLSSSARWQAKLNASFSNNKLEFNEDTRFLEAGLGFAFRSVSNDRLNILGRFTALYDLPPTSQSDDVSERSLITSLEGIYDFTHFLSLGSKLARRESEILLSRNSGTWIGNDASLLGIRLLYRVPFGIESILGYHWLQSEESQSLRSGALLAIGKNVSHHLKFSLGYNFANFDDDLTTDSYDFRGYFVNLVGKY